ncbi:MAG TPA: DUF3347 domain-containing protein [Opitutaceae bacterium]|nr:DUF3347 domain-containing protein [Opitutaceae bacterium]
MSIKSLLLALAFSGLTLPLTHAVAAVVNPADHYPLTTCVVSGDKLDDPVRYVYQQSGKPDRVVYFCCKDCIKDFQKDPAKYLAKIDAAAAGHPMTAGLKTMGSGKAMSCAMGADGGSCPMGAGMSGAAAAQCAAGGSLVQKYVPIADALAADDLAQAKTAAAALAQEASVAGVTKLGDSAKAIANATSLKAARDSLKQLSAAIEPMAHGMKGYVVMHCPMVDADWIQTSADVRNPYFGKEMLGCGEPKAD